MSYIFVFTAPTWTWISEAAARELYEDHSQPAAFIRSIFVNLFTDFQAFHLNLPADLKAEYEIICMLLLNPPSEREIKNTRDLMKKEITYQRDRVRTKITQPRADAVAMLATTEPQTNSPPIPLVKRDNQWYPPNGIAFQRAEGSNVSAFPILEKDGRYRDTMFALKKNPELPRSHWNYFCISPQGILTSCTKS